LETLSKNFENSIPLLLLMKNALLTFNISVFLREIHNDVFFLREEAINVDMRVGLREILLLESNIIFTRNDKYCKDNKNL